MKMSRMKKLAGAMLAAVLGLTTMFGAVPALASSTQNNTARGQAGPVYLYCRASEYATLRQSPSTSAAALTTIKSRESVLYQGVSGDFYYVSYYGQYGYVLQDFFSLDPYADLNTSAGPSSSGSQSQNANTTTMYCCASQYVNLRESASREARSLGTISTREAVTYLSTYGDFYYVSYKGINGYVLKDFFSTDPNAPLNYGSGSVTPSSSSTLYCCASEAATLRSIASRSGQALAMVQSRQAVTYLDTVGEFYHVRFGNQEGYVLAAYFSADRNAPLNYGTN